MAFKAHILKKFRRWLRQIEGRREPVTMPRSSLSVQVGRLLQTRGAEIITMTTL